MPSDARYVIIEHYRVRVRTMMDPRWSRIADDENYCIYLVLLPACL